LTGPAPREGAEDVAGREVEAVEGTTTLVRAAGCCWGADPFIHASTNSNMEKEKTRKRIKRWVSIKSPPESEIQK